MPPSLIPIYQRASRAYSLGPAGPSILAAINEIETGFGANQGPSSAGALGWMQFMPATWAGYGVDANGDGRKDPSDPEDAIFAAARYLRAGGMPEDPEAAIFSYNHADWYVADVLARAACFGGLDAPLLGPGGLSLLPETSILSCRSAEGAGIPDAYLGAFEDAAARYDLAEEGVWALAAVARLESDFGRGMSPEQLAGAGPLGLDEWEWKRFAVDGDANGRVAHESPADSAATLARMVWSGGSLREGLFEHNQAAWYVNEVLDEATQLGGKCKVEPGSYAIALPGLTSASIVWRNIELSNALELLDMRQGTLDPRVLALIGAISQQHRITISALRSDHSMHTTSGNVSNHFFGRAVDIAAVDGVPCTVTTVSSPCGRLVRTLAMMPAGQGPTELIFCFDADGAGPAFAAPDHCDHIHAGYDG
ncbi:MAG: lytic transglycosylase domain-containing protein [Solirubrobacterales bacterium]|nr:lytic transglycosylase domain-containing protein [Solirubrobacterales bacterium]